MARVAAQRAGVIVRAVLDTNVLVPDALRRDLQSLAQAELFVGIWSPWIIAELNRVLTWRWIRQRGGDLSRANERACAHAAKSMMELLFATFELVHPRPPYPPAWETLTDPWDIPVWAATTVGQATYVVSENTRDFPPADPEGHHIHEGITYLTGQEFLGLIAGDSAEDEPDSHR